MRRVTLVCLIVGLGLGIALGAHISWRVALPYLGLAVVVSWRWKLTWVIGLSVGVVCGMWRWQSDVENVFIQWKPHHHTVMSVTGITLVDAAGRVEITHIRSPKLPGRVSLGLLTIVPGQSVTIECRFELSEMSGRVLANRSVGRCLKVLLRSSRTSHHPTAILARWRAAVVRRFERGLRTAPAALATGLLLGDDSAFSDGLRNSFRATGTTHIVALSGFNVAIILALVLERSARLIGRRRASGVGLTFLVAFVVMTGAAASVVRAAIMASVAVIARLFGRPVDPWRVICYAVLPMVFMNPALLFHDLGFQLSVASTAGMMLGVEPLTSRLRAVPEFFGLRDNLATTMAATVATLPIILGSFGRFSFVSLPVNVVVLPFIPLAMAVSAIHAVSSMFGPAIEIMSRGLTELLLSLIISIIEFGAHIPHAGMMISPLVGVAMIVAIGAGAMLLYRHAPDRH